jgi:hypothetical protein
VSQKRNISAVQAVDEVIDSYKPILQQMTIEAANELTWIEQAAMFKSLNKLSEA